jgi:hypothetical protein
MRLHDGVVCHFEISNKHGSVKNIDSKLLFNSVVDLDAGSDIGVT